MKIKSEEAKEIILCGKYGDWIEVESSIVGKRSLAIENEGIFKRVASGIYYRVRWDSATTENEEDYDYFEDHDDYEFVEVEQKEVLVNLWVEK